MYDRDVVVRSSGARLDALFSDEMLAGGYRKKYRRALSRLTAMARAELPASTTTGLRSSMHVRQVLCVEVRIVR